ncbi:catechol 1,2-dioxygenase [Trinickia dinghuensis]|uniref:catechol 1,2-dioxygenase n=1 Tax=Trinickia dinghuensis TaxID=2291023 RepID=A0A3D8JU99_9BURK|nr:catechol 1,2-dioxygenase [Trinickia dinghuensis]RDU96226.1 catechol 1,2-dioxygenase [Trinickia dinghuensis]
MNKQAIDALLKTFDDAAKKPGNPRVRAIVNRIVKDLFHTIEDFDVQPSEFWGALNYLNEAGKEFGLIAPGLGFERFLDVRMDEAEEKAGIRGGTPRTIEGPLYVAGAPESNGHARLDDGTEPGQTLIMRGQVRGDSGEPLANALVEVWHANHLGCYSYFDQSQPAFNLRRSIRTDAQGRYSFRSVLPVGYSVPPGSKTEQLLDLLGREGHRPAHIHFFVTVPGYRKLTTQINIEGDPLIWDDFAFATRDGLIPAVKQAEGAEGKPYGIDGQFALIDFDFTLVKEQANVPAADVERVRAHG